MTKIFDKIVEEAQKQGLSISEVAKRSNISTQSLYMWNKNDENIKIKNVHNVANALNISPAYLLGWSNENKNQESIFELTEINNKNVTYKDQALSKQELRAFCAMLEELRS